MRMENVEQLNARYGCAAWGRGEIRAEDLGIETVEEEV